MSLYNLLHGVNPGAGQLLALLGKEQGDFGRFRDVYIKDNYIVVHTRCGGGNRDDYQDVFDEAALHPWYSHDEDSDYDSTYADIYFEMPEEHIKTFATLCGVGNDPTKAWDEVLKNLVQT